MRSMKHFSYTLLVFILFTAVADAQVHRIGGGLSFSSGTEFNSGETGNPGLQVKTWVSVNRSGTLHLVPSVSAYNRYRLETGFMILNNYMFHGNLDAQFTVLEEGSVRGIVFGGGNFMYLTSTFEPVIVTGNETLEDAQDHAFGGNLGAGLELRMAPQWDFNVSGKYLFSRYSQFIISVDAAYYFKRRRRGYRR